MVSGKASGIRVQASCQSLLCAQHEAGAQAGHGDHPPRRWESQPGHEDHPPRRRESQAGHRDHPPRRWESQPGHGDHPPRRRESQAGHGDHPPWRWQNDERARHTHTHTPLPLEKPRLRRDKAAGLSCPQSSARQEMSPAGKGVLSEQGRRLGRARRKPAPHAALATHPHGVHKLLPQIQVPIWSPPSRHSVRGEGVPPPVQGCAKTTRDSQEGVRSERGVRGLGSSPQVRFLEEGDWAQPACAGVSAKGRGGCFSSAQGPVGSRPPGPGAWRPGRGCGVPHGSCTWHRFPSAVPSHQLTTWRDRLI